MLRINHIIFIPTTRSRVLSPTLGKLFLILKLSIDSSVYSWGVKGEKTSKLSYCTFGFNNILFVLYPSHFSSTRCHCSLTRNTSWPTTPCLELSPLICLTSMIRERKMKGQKPRLKATPQRNLTTQNKKGKWRERVPNSGSNYTLANLHLRHARVKLNPHTAQIRAVKASKGEHHEAELMGTDSTSLTFQSNPYNNRKAKVWVPFQSRTCYPH